MNGHNDCPAAAHVHPVQGLLVFHGYGVMLDHNAVALCTDATVADRLVELLERHGLLDVPDSLASPWPPPQGAPAT